MREYRDILTGQKRASFSESLPDLKTRLERLRRFEQFTNANSKAICEAVAGDMKRPALEIYSSEIVPVLAELRKAKKHLADWMKPARAKTSLFNVLAKSRHYPVPYGSALIIGPWNYPFMLLAVPAVNALAAGNRVILKPSEYAPNTARLLQEKLTGFFEPLEIACFEGGGEDTARMIEAGPDIVFFTGGAGIGKKVMQACAGRLIPVVLELGGCNPCIIDGEVDLTVAARRVAWGKFFNAGQTCLAPNTCFVHEDIYSDFTAELCRTLERFYGKNPRESKDLGRIVNNRHFTRLEEIKNRAEGRILVGGGADSGELFMEPTILELDGFDSPMVQEEIFGPILPLCRYRNLDELLEKLRKLAPPLVVSCFTKNESVKDLVRRKTVSGSLVFNGTLHVAASTSLPFGGVGMSGMGRYHGKAGFDQFSYRRAELDKPFFPDFSFIYPPYRAPMNVVRKAMKYFIR
ncbi:MAG: aldehyde dehydrogenase family protein [Syntrophotaleaceae bacterium]